MREEAQHLVDILDEIVGARMPNRIRGEAHERDVRDELDVVIV